MIQHQQFAEDIGAASLEFSIPNPVASAVNVTFSYSFGSGREDATLWQDFSFGSTEGTIPAGETTGAIRIFFVNDNFDERNERFIVQMHSVHNAVIGSDRIATITIEDNDVPEVSIAATSTPAREGANATADFTIISSQSSRVQLNSLLSSS